MVFAVLLRLDNENKHNITGALLRKSLHMQHDAGRLKGKTEIGSTRAARRIMMRRVCLSFTEFE